MLKPLNNTRLIIGKIGAAVNPVHAPICSVALDHRVEAAHNLPKPVTIEEVRRLPERGRSIFLFPDNRRGIRRFYAAGKHGTDTPMPYKDMELICRVCGSPFIFTAGEQEFYADKGFLHEPTRCPACRRSRSGAQDEDALNALSDDDGDAEARPKPARRANQQRRRTAQSKQLPRKR